MNAHLITRQLAYRLGWSAMAPFALLALGCWTAGPEWLGVFIKAQLAYGVLMLAHLGAIHWGAAVASANLTAERSRRSLIWVFVLLSLAWFATMIGGFGFALLILGFIAAYQFDKRMYPWYPMPEWAIRLRFGLTLATVALLVLTVIAANIKG